MIIWSTCLWFSLMLGDDPAPASKAPVEEPSSASESAAGATESTPPSKEVRPKKSLKKGGESKDSALPKPESKPEDAPIPEDDRPIPKPGDEGLDPNKTDEMLEEELGQDLEAANNPDQDPLSRVAEGMKQAEERLAQRTGSETVGLQEKIIKDLDELLAQAENPPPSGGQKGSKKKQRMQQQKSQQKSQQQMAQKNQSQQRGRKPGEQIGPPRATQEELTPTSQERNVWGHLSEMMREEMGQYANENFLGKYRDLIERYYTDIARQSTSKP